MKQTDPGTEADDLAITEELSLCQAILSFYLKLSEEKKAWLSSTNSATPFPNESLLKQYESWGSIARDAISWKRPHVRSQKELHFVQKSILLFPQLNSAPNIPNSPTSGP